jgi:hypothetical protein
VQHGADVAPAAAGLAAPVAVVTDEQEEDPEELVFEDNSSDVGAPAQPEEVFIPVADPSSGEDEDEVGSGGDGFIPVFDADDYHHVPASEPESEEPQEAERPGYIDAFMPAVDMRRFDHLAFAFLHPNIPNPDSFILQAADLGCGPDRVSLFPSSHGTRLAVFSAPSDRENAINNGPFLGREASVFFRRHNETDNRFLFGHEAMAALAVAKYPMEFWQRSHITKSSVPYANPHEIDPICLAGVDFHLVLITVKAESLSSIPHHLTVKNHCGEGSIGDISIIDFEDLEAGVDGPDGPAPGLAVDAFGHAGDEDGILLEGGTGIADMMQVLGIPAPAVPHSEPHAVAPAASIERALAHAPPLPVVRGSPISTKSAKVDIKLRLGFFEVSVTGQNGEHARFWLPLRKAGADPGSKGLMVANFAAASVDLIDSIAEVGPLRQQTLTVDVLARGEPLGCLATIAEAEALVMGLAPQLGMTSGHLLQGSPPSASPAASAKGCSPSVALLAAETSPVRAAVWPTSPPEARLRRCSRLAQATFVSIVDKAILRQKEKNEGPSAPARRRGELLADDLLAVALAEGHPLHSADVHVLARACDVNMDSLDLSAAPSSVAAASP